MKEEGVGAWGAGEDVVCSLQTLSLPGSLGRADSNTCIAGWEVREGKLICDCTVAFLI